MAPKNTNASDGYIPPSLRDLLNPAALARITVLAVVLPLDTVPFYGMGTVYGGGMVSQERWDEVTGAAERTAQDAVRRTVAQLHTPTHRPHDQARTRLSHKGTV